MLLVFRKAITEIKRSSHIIWGTWYSHNITDGANFDHSRRYLPGLLFWSYCFSLSILFSLEESQSLLSLKGSGWELGFISLWGKYLHILKNILYINGFMDMYFILWHIIQYNTATFFFSQIGLALALEAFKLSSVSFTHFYPFTLESAILQEVLVSFIREWC